MQRTQFEELTDCARGFKDYFPCRWGFGWFPAGGAAGPLPPVWVENRHSQNVSVYSVHCPIRVFDINDDALARAWDAKSVPKLQELLEKGAWRNRSSSSVLVGVLNEIGERVDLARGHRNPV